MLFVSRPRRPRSSGRKRTGSRSRPCRSSKNSSSVRRSRCRRTWVKLQPHTSRSSRRENVGTGCAAARLRTRRRMCPSKGPRLRRQFVERTAEDFRRELVGERNVLEGGLDVFDHAAPALVPPARTLVLVQERNRIDQGQVFFMVAPVARPPRTRRAGRARTGLRLRRARGVCRGAFFRTRRSSRALPPRPPALPGSGAPAVFHGCAPSARATRPPRE